MYKVFVNEKMLSIAEKPTEAEKNFRFEDSSTLEIAVDLLENTSCKSVNIFSEDAEDVFKGFSKIYRVIKAAGGIIKNKNGETLFIHRLGKWDLPKGKIEKGEEPAEAAVREVDEETGLKSITLQDFITAAYHVYTERNGSKVLKITYWYRMNFGGSELPKPQTEEGITEARWMTDDEIKSTVLPNTFENIRLILTGTANSAES